MRIRDLESLRPWIGDPGWKKTGSGIRDKHLRSATLEKKSKKSAFCTKMQAHWRKLYSQQTYSRECNETENKPDNLMKSANPTILLLFQNNISFSGALTSVDLRFKTDEN